MRRGSHRCYRSFIIWMKGHILPFFSIQSPILMRHFRSGLSFSLKFFAKVPVEGWPALNCFPSGKFRENWKKFLSSLIKRASTMLFFGSNSLILAGGCGNGLAAEGTVFCSTCFGLTSDTGGIVSDMGETGFVITGSDFLKIFDSV